MFNALLDGIEANALTPAKWRTKFPGADLSSLTENATTEARSKMLRDAINGIHKNLTDPVFNTVESRLAPVTRVLDGVNAQSDATIDSALKGNLTKPGATRSTTLASSPVSSIPALDGVLRTINLDGGTIGKAEKTAKKATDSAKTAQGKHAADPSALKKSVKDTVDKVRTGVTDAVGKVEKAGKDMVKAVGNAAKPAKEHSKDNAPKGKHPKASGKHAA